MEDLLIGTKQILSQSQRSIDEQSEILDAMYEAEVRCKTKDTVCKLRLAGHKMRLQASRAERDNKIPASLPSG